MNSNISTNMANVMGGRINASVKTALNNSATAEDVAIANVRAGFQQRYGAIQMEDLFSNQYAMFGAWSNSGNIVGP